MSLSNSKRTPKSDSRKTIKNQNQFPGNAMGSQFLGFSCKSRLDKHQSGMASRNWFCTCHEHFSTSKTMSPLLNKSTSCLSTAHGDQVENLAGNEALHFLYWSWLEYDNLGCLVFFSRSILAVLIHVLCPVTYAVVWYKLGKKISLSISSLHSPSRWIIIQFRQSLLFLMKHIHWNKRNY